MHESAHHQQHQANLWVQIMKVKSKTGRLRADQGGSPFSALACLLLLLLSGMLVKFAALSPMVHVAHWY
jgi:hypothetical protein